MGEWINGKKIIQAYNVIIGNDVYSIPWTDYSGISTIVGWSSYIIKQIFYKKTGKTVFVRFYIQGTSNNTASTFTVPFIGPAAPWLFETIWGMDNGSWATRPCVVLPNSQIVSAYTTRANGAWTASGDKRVIGSFRYETP